MEKTIVIYGSSTGTCQTIAETIAEKLGVEAIDVQNLKIDDIIVKQRGSISIVKDRIECDLYDWLENKNDSKYKYLGDYMNQYSWSEFMHAELDEISYDMWDEEDEDQ